MKAFFLPVFILYASFSYAQQEKARTGTVYTTAEKTALRISENGKLTFKPLKQPVETQVCIFVDPSKTFQSVTGIGGSITDAVAETFAKLPKASQDEWLTAYYDKRKGIGYSLARTTIHSSDFSSGSYTYVQDHDADLKTFNLAHDEVNRIPLIKKAIASAGGKLPLYVSPWSPPAWMKTNSSMLQGGKLKPEFRQNWANYYVKFIKAYEAKGIPVWGLTVQNEPMATQTWESCIYTAEEERDFIKEYLGPTLKKNGLSDKKLIAWDHNRDQIFQRANTLLSDPEAAKYIWGIGFHWYETWTGSDMLFDNVKLVHETFPDKQLVFTEGCVEKFNLDSVANWSLGERYGYSMINDFRSGVTAWTDWNMLLDEKGGPNHVGNFCFAPIHADTRTGKLIYTNSYYYLGHFSKFVSPGAKRIASSANRDKLLTTAFINLDGKVVVIVMNKSKDTIPYYLWINGNAAETTSLPHSISTLIIE
ncbi:glycoside hydrolase family 30 protein [Pedobacter metabolipauper]|uniref:Glucosylceramidase n=1 Tax=Pedobacter metabolipauper TaxID=425513 RepID=A0A4R6SSV7_9SPHI|nr:glycoside hydrolase family 30 beta sandwich domain-containing protein [Pedobacter metabolipauper]TDQ07003.1 glucosylceramidase [Pedobacter metabolipauper]